MKTHIKTIHEKGDHNKSLHGDSKVFSRPYRLLFHHLPDEGIKQFKCNICHRDFFEKETFKTHMKEHLNQKLFNCALCAFKCAKIKDLVKHFKKTHKLKK